MIINSDLLTRRMYRWLEAGAFRVRAKGQPERKARLKNPNFSRISLSTFKPIHHQISNNTEQKLQNHSTKISITSKSKQLNMASDSQQDKSKEEQAAPINSPGTGEV